MNIIKKLYYYFKGNYKDTIGRWRTKDGFLIDRMIGNKIYKKKRSDYPLPYSYYYVHHMDGNRENNSKKNIRLYTKIEYQFIHGKMGRNAIAYAHENEISQQVD